MAQSRSVSLAITMAAGLLLTAGALAGGVAIFHGGRNWWQGWIAAAIITCIATLMSLAPLVPGLMMGGQWAVYGYLAGTAMRLLVTMLSCTAAIWVFRMPAVPTMMLAMPLYFVQLVIEAIAVSRSFAARQGALRTQ